MNQQPLHAEISISTSVNQFNQCFLTLIATANQFTINTTERTRHFNWWRHNN